MGKPALLVTGHAVELAGTPRQEVPGVLAKHLPFTKVEPGLHVYEQRFGKAMVVLFPE